MDFAIRRTTDPFDGTPRLETRTEFLKANPRLRQGRQGQTLFVHRKLHPPIIHSMLLLNNWCNIGSPSPQNDGLQRMKLLSQVAINTVISSTFVRHDQCLWNRGPTLWHKRLREFEYVMIQIYGYYKLLKSIHQMAMSSTWCHCLNIT